MALSNTSAGKRRSIKPARKAIRSELVPDHVVPTLGQIELSSTTPRNCFRAPRCRLISMAPVTVWTFKSRIGSGFVIGSGFGELLFAREVAVAVQDRDVSVGHDELGRGAAVVFQ